jgi:2-methylaconitate cis-trans-isomerase PrpF
MYISLTDVCVVVIFRTATCGNMLAAVALASISQNIVPYTTLHRLRSSQTGVVNNGDTNDPLSVPVRILAANTGAVLTARVLVDPLSLQLYEPPAGNGARIAGVPGEAAPVEVELPLETGGSGGLVTGNPVDVVDIDGHKVIMIVSLFFSSRRDYADNTFCVFFFKRSKYRSLTPVYQTSSSTRDH